MENQERQRVIIAKSANSILAQQLSLDGKTRIGKKYKFAAGKKPVNQSFEFGLDFGKLLISSKIKKIRFDRNGNTYHGRIKSFAEGIRKAGVEF